MPKTIIEKYRTLPEANSSAPDWVWQWHKAERELQAVTALFQASQDEARERALMELRALWSDDELRAAGLI